MTNLYTLKAYKDTWNIAKVYMLTCLQCQCRQQQSHPEEWLVIAQLISCAKIEIKIRFKIAIANFAGCTQHAVKGSTCHQNKNASKVFIPGINMLPQGCTFNPDKHAVGIYIPDKNAAIASFVGGMFVPMQREVCL